MSNSELIDHLKQLNPVTADPPAPAIEPLLARLDQTARTLDEPIRVPSPRASRGPRFRIAVACATAAAAVGVFVALGSSGGGTPNVMADVYRALTPGSGVLHMVEVSEQSAAGKTSTTREQVWIPEQRAVIQDRIALGECHIVGQARAGKR